MLVSEYLRQRVVVLARVGGALLRVLLQEPDVQRPAGLAVLPCGTLAIASNVEGRGIVLHSMREGWTRRVDVAATDLQLGKLTGLALDSQGRIFVCDFDKNVVLVYS